MNILYENIFFDWPRNIFFSSHQISVTWSLELDTHVWFFAPTKKWKENRYEMIIVLACLVVVLLGFVKFFIQKHKLMKYVQQLPSPPEYPIVGSSFRFFGKNSQRMWNSFLVSFFSSFDFLVLNVVCNYILQTCQNVYLKLLFVNSVRRQKRCYKNGVVIENKNTYLWIVWSSQFGVITLIACYRRTII